MTALSAENGLQITLTGTATSRAVHLVSHENFGYVDMLLLSNRIDSSERNA